MASLGIGCRKVAAEDLMPAPVGIDCEPLLTLLVHLISFEVEAHIHGVVCL
jgi:hypothetical protein